MNCWKCHKGIGDAHTKIGFRAVCVHCGVDLHTCTNCRYYAPGKPNDCSVPGTESIRDREQGNFCEEFKVATESPAAVDPTTDKGQKFKSLFKD